MKSWSGEAALASTTSCPSCRHRIQIYQVQNNIVEHGHRQLPVGMPAGVKFDPSDQELLEHLEGKARPELQKLHPLIDEFIPSIDGENGICYTHPDNLPGVRRDGMIRHFFHRPSKAYTTGTRKRRKVHSAAADDRGGGGETRWHKTGKTRPVFAGDRLIGHKKIMVLYASYGKQRKPEKTNWVMHQYHLGDDDEEKDGELVVSKVFYQTQPRQCGGAATAPKPAAAAGDDDEVNEKGGKDANLVNIHGASSSLERLDNFAGHGGRRRSSPSPPPRHLVDSFDVHAHGHFLT